MRLNKTAKTGLLLCLYLSRAGRAKIEDVAVNLGITIPFLYQVATKLRKSGVIKSVRGPGGGYELKADVTMRETLDALEAFELIHASEIAQSLAGAPEERAMLGYVMNLGKAMTLVLNRKVSSVMQELIVNERAQMTKVEDLGAVH